jgi:hypothetical protein
MDHSQVECPPRRKEGAALETSAASFDPPDPVRFGDVADRFCDLAQRREAAPASAGSEAGSPGDRRAIRAAMLDLLAEPEDAA